jgi:GIY-YIG catalytic domain
MANPNAKTLQIFLPTGEPRGIRIAELTTRIIQAVLIPRSELATAKTRPELDHLSVYFLFGDSEEAAKPIVYVGQTEDVKKRIDHHNGSKDFWQTAILVISKTHSFTQAHIRYLEWYCIKKAKEIGRYDLNNDQIPSKPFVPEPMEADLLDAFDALATLVATLGHPVFEPIAKNGAAEQFFLKGKDAEAVGDLVEDGFVVRAGSIARVEVVPSAQDTVPSMRRSSSKTAFSCRRTGTCVSLRTTCSTRPSVPSPWFWAARRMAGSIGRTKTAGRSTTSSGRIWESDEASCPPCWR